MNMPITMSGLVYSTQQHSSCTPTCYHAHSEGLRNRLAAQASDDAFRNFNRTAPLETTKFAYTPYCGYQEEGFVLAATDKAAKAPVTSRATSFNVLAARDMPALQLSSPCNVAAEASGAEDVLPRAPAAAVIPTADELLGGSPPAASCQTDAAAYRSVAQQLAWAHGQLMTYSAVAQPQQPRQQFVASAPAGPIVIDHKWNFEFICLEAAAKIGMKVTYAMAAAGAC